MAEKREEGCWTEQNCLNFTVSHPDEKKQKKADHDCFVLTHYLRVFAASQQISGLIFRNPGVTAAGDIVSRWIDSDSSKQTQYGTRIGRTTCARHARLLLLLLGPGSIMQAML